VFREVRKYRVGRFQIAEASGERKVVLRGQALVAKDDHQMIKQRRTHGGECRVVQPRKIDAVDLGADGRRNRAYVERSGTHERRIPRSHHFVAADHALPDFHQQACSGPTGPQQQRAFPPSHRKTLYCLPGSPLAPVARIVEPDVPYSTATTASSGTGAAGACLVCEFS
jgi:hypothetical protein